MKLSHLGPKDCENTLSFWRHSEGLGTGAVETTEMLSSFLKRNPGLSFKVTDRDEIVGTILCAHDGRRGYLHHLAIKSSYSDHSVGKTLIDRTLRGLDQLGIRRCHVFIATDNQGGQISWKSGNWKERDNLMIYSHDIEFPTT